MRMIDADELIRNLEGIISDYTSNGFYPDRFGIDDFIDVVKEIPTIHSPQWISVEDRLPNKYRLVIITDGEHIEEGYINNYGIWSFGNGLRWETSLKAVTHWMPMPEPPEEVRDDGAHIKPELRQGQSGLLGRD